MSQYLCVYRWNEQRDLFELVSAVQYDDTDVGFDGVRSMLSKLMHRLYPEGWSPMYWDGEMLQSTWRHGCAFGVFQDVESVVLDSSRLFDTLTSLMENYW